MRGTWRGGRVAFGPLGEALRLITQLHYKSHLGQSSQPHYRWVLTCKKETVTAACRHLTEKRIYSLTERLSMKKSSNLFMIEVS